MNPSSIIRQINLLFVFSVACAATAGAASYEWIQAIPPAWSSEDAAQNQPVKVVDGQAYDSTNLKAYTADEVIWLWTDSESEAQGYDHVLTSADVQSTYELEPASPGILKQIDLWVDNSSEYRNAVDVEIYVSYDGGDFEKLFASENLCGTRVEEGTCNLLTLDFPDETKPISALRIVDKVAVTAVQGPRSPRWLQWDVFLKQ